MFYSLLGRVVWFAAKVFLRRRYGHLRGPALAGATMATAALATVAVMRSRS